MSYIMKDNNVELQYARDGMLLLEEKLPSLFIIRCILACTRSCKSELEKGVRRS